MKRILTICIAIEALTLTLTLVDTQVKRTRELGIDVHCEALVTGVFNRCLPIEIAPKMGC